MAAPRVLILRAPGTNCDEETAYAFQLAGGVPQRIHINRLLENPRLATQYQIFCIPGGFSYGDDIAAGRILASQIERHLEQTLAEFQSQEKLILGICNGFQVLLKSSVLVPHDEGAAPIATLTWNDSGKFEDRWVDLSVFSNRCVFLRNADSMYLPVAHAEGKFVAGDQKSLDALREKRQLVLRYAAGPGQANGPVSYPANPNGSMADVAGICDESGRVFGLMPHPERHLDVTHHPRWTRGEVGGSGRCIFENAIQYFSES